MRGELAELQRRLGITCVVVTYDQDAALAMATRCAVMNAGRLEQAATPAALCEAPALRFVAGFIGAVNIFEGLGTRTRELSGPYLAARLADLAAHPLVGEALSLGLMGAVEIVAD